MSEHEKPTQQQQQWSCEQGEGRRVLVTGATGFTATHLIDLLLRNGWKVRATVRDVNNEAKVGPVRRLGAEEGEEPKSELELVAADLLKDEDWSEAAKECDYIVHLAAIDPKSCKKDQSDMTWKTLKGLHNVLNSAFMSGSVKRFILAGSLAAVQGGLCGEDGRTYSEEDWTDPEKKDLHAWAEFKTKAELEAMKFVQALPSDEKFHARAASGTRRRSAADAHRWSQSGGHSKHAVRKDADGSTHVHCHHRRARLRVRLRRSDDVIEGRAALCGLFRHQVVRRPRENSARGVRADGLQDCTASRSLLPHVDLRSVRPNGQRHERGHRKPLLLRQFQAQDRAARDSS